MDGRNGTNEEVRLAACAGRADPLSTGAMLITDLRTHPIAIADPPLRSSYGLHAAYALRTIVELESDEGVVGISETYGSEGQVRQLEALRGRIVGASPYRLSGLLSSMVEGQGAGAERSQN